MLKSYAAIIVIFCALFQITNGAFCPQNATRPEAEVAKLLQDIQSKSMSAEKLQVLYAYINSSSLAFSGIQVNRIVPLFPFTDDKCAAVRNMNPYILGLNASDIVVLLNSISFSTERLAVLRAVADTLLDATPVNKQKIVDTFSMSSDKEQATQILSTVVSRNCIFGTVKEPVAIFLIDLSGSMDYKFTDPESGKTMSRLDFVKVQLSQVIAEQLKPYQMFNIIGFSSAIFPWQPNTVNSTKENIASGLKFLNALVAKGGTNLMLGMQSALAEKNMLRGIYLLSDGVPNEGTTSTEQIVKNSKDLIAKRSKSVVINTTAFLLGEQTKPEEKVQSAKLMRTIAESTGGVFRNMDSK